MPICHFFTMTSVLSFGFVMCTFDQTGQINAFLKRLYKYGFPCELMRLETLINESDKRLFHKMGNQAHCLHSVLPPLPCSASLQTRPKGHPYELQRKSFVLRCLYNYSAKKLKLRRVLQILCGAFERCSRVRL